jgi:hypothetical protein
MVNPYEKDGKWYFYDETQDEHGPYPTEEKAYAEFTLYGIYLNEGPNGLVRELRKRWEDAEQACFDITESLTSECRRLYKELEKANLNSKRVVWKLNNPQPKKAPGHEVNVVRSMNGPGGIEIE